MKRHEVFWDIIKDGSLMHRDFIIKRMDSLYDGSPKNNPSAFSIFSGLLIAMGLMVKEKKMFQYIGNK